VGEGLAFSFLWFLWGRDQLSPFFGSCGLHVSFGFSLAFPFCLQGDGSKHRFLLDFKNSLPM